MTSLSCEEMPSGWPSEISYRIRAVVNADWSLIPIPKSVNTITTQFTLAGHDDRSRQHVVLPGAAVDEKTEEADPETERISYGKLSTPWRTGTRGSTWSIRRAAVS